MRVKFIKRTRREERWGTFTTENLVALREIALRRTADRINRISDKIKQSQSSDYYTDEHIMVCLSSSPTNARLIRTAARMANAFKGNFTALFVETPDFSRMEDENKERLRKNMKLAQQLGAHIETTYGDNIALQISRICKAFRRFQGSCGKVKRQTKKCFRTPVSDRTADCIFPNLDVYVIPDKNTPAYKAARRLRGDMRDNLLADLLKTLGMLAGATVIGTVFYECGFSEANIITIYILCVLVTSVITSRRIFSLILSAVCVFVFNFFLYRAAFYVSGVRQRISGHICGDVYRRIYHKFPCGQDQKSGVSCCTVGLQDPDSA